MKKGRKTKTKPTKTVLGSSAEIPLVPDDAVLDAINTEGHADGVAVRFTCPEFTCLCPVTNQPDFATIIIDYIPNKWIIESKSLKLFLHSFRNYGDFHEGCVKTIGLKIAKHAKPSYVRVVGYFNPRGGIPIDVLWEYGLLGAPMLLQLPDMTYRAR